MVQKVRGGRENRECERNEITSRVEKTSEVREGRQLKAIFIYQ